MEEIYLIALFILVYLVYNLFVPPHYDRKSNLLDESSLKTLFRH